MEKGYEWLRVALREQSVSCYSNKPVEMKMPLKEWGPKGM